MSLRREHSHHQLQGIDGISAKSQKVDSTLLHHFTLIATRHITLTNHSQDSSNERSFSLHHNALYLAVSLQIFLLNEDSAPWTRVEELVVVPTRWAYLDALAHDESMVHGI
jgi:hypothetical protein